MYADILTQQKNYTGRIVLLLESMDESSPFADNFCDPRVSPTFCTHLPGETGDVTILGVVHGHPASVGRVETVLERRSPATLALELPAGAIPLYRTYAEEIDETGRPRYGDEMSAAIAAAPDAAVVGIDAPAWSFLRRLVTRLVGGRVTPTTARRVLSSFGRVTRTSLSCRVAASVSDAPATIVAPDDPVEYGVEATDPPDRQAAHECAHLAGVRALDRCAGDSVRHRDDLREACMIDRLRALRHRGDVVAVVGVGHLDAIAAGLDVDADPRRS